MVMEARLEPGGHLVVVWAGGKGQNKSCNGKQGWPFVREPPLCNCHIVWCCHGARAVPAWFPGVWEQGWGCWRAESCSTCLGSSGMCWQATVTGGSPSGRFETLSSVYPPSLPSNRSEDELWFLQDFKTSFNFFLCIIRSFVLPEAVITLGASWQHEMEDPGGHEGRPGGACWAWMGSGVFWSESLWLHCHLHRLWIVFSGTDLVPQCCIISGRKARSGAPAQRLSEADEACSVCGASLSFLSSFPWDSWSSLNPRAPSSTAALSPPLPAHLADATSALEAAAGVSSGAGLFALAGSGQAGSLHHVGALNRRIKDVQPDLRGREYLVGLWRNLFSNSRTGGCNPTPGNLFAVSLALVTTLGHCSMPVNSADSLSIFGDFPWLWTVWILMGTLILGVWIWSQLLPLIALFSSDLGCVIGFSLKYLQNSISVSKSVFVLFEEGLSDNLFNLGSVYLGKFNSYTSTTIHVNTIPFQSKKIEHKETLWSARIKPMLFTLFKLILSLAWTEAIL